MTTLAERDTIINHLQHKINEYKIFLGGGIKFSTKEKEQLEGLKRYLECIGRGGEKDLETVSALLTQN